SAPPPPRGGAHSSAREASRIGAPRPVVTRIGPSSRSRAAWIDHPPRVRGAQGCAIRSVFFTNAMSAVVTLPPPAEPRLELVVRTRDSSRAVPIEPGKVLGVGRGEENAIRLECPSVSRMHLELHASRDGLEVEDLGSSNGTVLIRGSAEP